MKIYIHTDLEGIAGIDTIEMMARDHDRHGGGLPVRTQRYERHQRYG